ncbi:MAG: hypothetical protein M3506_10715, partial [Chloroflexota bacterium]|nr:hypothetical protein [Chloroflexota bacterium]
MDTSVNNLALARRYIEIGQPERALQALDAAGGDVLHAALYWRLRAQAFLQMERYPDAQDALMTGLAEGPDDIVLLYLSSIC